MTLTGVAEALSRVAVNMKWECSPLPSVMARSAMDTFGAVLGDESTSSLVMMPIAAASAMVAFDALDRFSVNCSLSSYIVSPTMATLTILLVSPGAKLSVPTVGVKSPAVAVSVLVLYPTLTVLAAAFDSSTVKFIADVPVLPSAMLRSPTDKVGSGVAGVALKIRFCHSVRAPLSRAMILLVCSWLRVTPDSV